MKRLIQSIAALLCLLATPGFSTPKLRSADLLDVLTYDSSVVSQFAVRAPRVGFRGAVNGARLIVSLAQTDQNGMRFATLDLRTMSMTSMSIAVNGLDNLQGAESVRALAFDREYLWLVTDYRELLICRRDGESFRHKATHKLDDSYGYLGMQRGQAIAAKIYNSHPLDSPHKTILRLFDPVNADPRQSMYPEFDFIELSHFEPHHWVDIARNHIACARAASYHVKIYNRNLEETATLQRRPSSWLPIDVALGRDRVKDIDPSQAKAKIDAVSPLYYDASSLNEVHFLGDSILAVKIRVKRYEDGYARYSWDFWRYRDEDWHLAAQDMIQSYAQRQPKRRITQADFPLIPDRSMMFYHGDYLIALRFGSGNSALNKSYQQFAEEEDNYIATNAPRLIADVFRWNWKE